MGAAKVPVRAQDDSQRHAYRRTVAGGPACRMPGHSAINTIRSVIGVNLETLRPEPSSKGFTTPGGYRPRRSCLWRCGCAWRSPKLIQSEFPGRTLSGIGGIESGRDASASSSSWGATRSQVCTYVMKVGYRCVRAMCDELAAFMEQHKFRTLAEFKGHSLPYFTTHYDLVRRQARGHALPEQQSRPTANRSNRPGNGAGDDFVRQSEALARG